MEEAFKEGQGPHEAVDPEIIMMVVGSKRRMENGVY
jgi:hypothetical protein